MCHKMRLYVLMCYLCATKLYARWCILLSFVYHAVKAAFYSRHIDLIVGANVYKKRGLRNIRIKKKSGFSRE